MFKLPKKKPEGEICLVKKKKKKEVNRIHPYSFAIHVDVIRNSKLLYINIHHSQ